MDPVSGIQTAWIQYQGFKTEIDKTEIDKHIYLRNIQDTNETLFRTLTKPSSTVW